MDTTTPSACTVGALVVVGPRYVMADHPPYAGNGRHEADEWTGRTFRVVAIEGRDAALAPADLVGADESDAVVYIHQRRLTLAPQQDTLLDVATATQEAVIAAIRAAPNLDALAKILEAATAREDSDDFMGQELMDALPRWGTKPDVDGAFSWDSTRVLLFDDTPMLGGWCLEQRPDVDESPAQ